MTIDPARPTYHYSAGNWMNDVIPYFDGERLHVYFIHNPVAAKWTKFSWGHASTADLVSWQTHPVALTPRAGVHDELGCWTGTVFDTPDGYRAAYTGIRSFMPLIQTQCFARSETLDAWTQEPEAAITDAPDGFGECFRDPFVYRLDAGWRMLVGSTEREPNRAAVLAFDSPDLVRWSYSGPFFVDESGELGSMAECPELFTLGDRVVLVTSAGCTRCVVGELDDDGRFVRTGPVTTFDPGDSYAAKSVDIGERRVQVAWARDVRDRADREAAGWSGALSLPRRLDIDVGGWLVVEPVAELVGLRDQLAHDGAVAIRSGSSGIVGGPLSHAFEAIVRLEAVQSGRTTILVGCESDGSGGVAVDVDWSAKTIGGFDVWPASGDTLDVRVFLDRSIVEVFTCGRVITRREYRLSESPHLGWRHEGRPTAASATVWQLQPSTHR